MDEIDICSINSNILNVIYNLYAGAVWKWMTNSQIILNITWGETRRKFESIIFCHLPEWFWIVN